MPHDTVLSKEEEGKIDIFRECGVIRNYLKLGHNHANRMKTKGNSKITRRAIEKNKEEASRNK